VKGEQVREGREGVGIVAGLCSRRKSGGRMARLEGRTRDLTAKESGQGRIFTGRGFD